MKPGQESTCQCRRLEFHPWVRKVPWRRKWEPTPVFLPGKCHGQRSLGGYNPWHCKELDMTERLNTHTHTQGSCGSCTCMAQETEFFRWVGPCIVCVTSQLTLAGSVGSAHSLDIHFIGDYFQLACLPRESRCSQRGFLCCGSGSFLYLLPLPFPLLECKVFTAVTLAC